VVPNGFAIDLDELECFEARDQSLQIPEEECFERTILQVTRRDKQQLVRQAMYDQGIDKIGVLRNDDTLIRNGKPRDLSIRSSIALRKVESMKGIVMQRPQSKAQAPRQLGIYEEPHAASVCTLLT
jgi:hypothetical protein